MSLICSDVKIFDKLLFEDYLKMPGHSYSGIKSESFPISEVSAKMQLGTRVHNYLLDPSSYDYKDLKIVKPLAIELKRYVGDAFKFLKTEIAVTCQMKHEGLSMPYKGRVDMCYPKKIVVDLKVSEYDISKTIPYFGYDFQVNGYGAALSCPLLLILSINPKTLQTKTVRIPKNTLWWENEVKKRGELIK